MKSITVKLNTIERVKSFVDILNKYTGEFDLISKKYTIDARSIMGILSFDIKEPLVLSISENSSLTNPNEILKDFLL